MPFCGYCGKPLAYGEKCSCPEAVQKNGGDTAGLHDYVCRYCGANVAAGQTCTCAQAQFEAKYIKDRPAPAQPLQRPYNAGTQSVQRQAQPYQPQNGYPNTQGNPYQQQNPYPNVQGNPYQQQPPCHNAQGNPYQQQNPYHNAQGNPYQQQNPYPNAQGNPYQQQNPYHNVQGNPYQQQNPYPNVQGSPYRQYNYPNYAPQPVPTGKKGIKGKLLLFAYIAAVLAAATLFYAGSKLFTGNGNSDSSSKVSKKQSAAVTATERSTLMTEPEDPTFVAPKEGLYDFPEDFSLVDEGLVNKKVKNQGKYGTCYAFSWIGAVENRLLAQGSDEDLSEWAYYKSFMDYYVSGNRTNDTAAAAQLNTALVPEDSAPYPGKDEAYEVDENIEKQSPYIISDVYYVTGNGDDTKDSIEKRAKKFLTDGYALICSVYYDDANGTYTNDLTGSWYVSNGNNNKYNTVNHSVMIVGWDDNYSKDNFITEPHGDGAWLVKNSWGIFSGDLGYYWLSYYDETLPNSELTAIDIKSSDICDKVQSYWCYGWDYGGIAPNSNTAISGEPMDEVYQACKYTAEEDMYITALSFFTVCDDTEYMAYIVSESDNSVTYDDTISRGTQQNRGYHMIELSTPRHIKKGEEYTIIIYMKSPEKDYLIVQDSEYTFDKQVARPAFANTCYVSTDGKEWFDVKSYSLKNNEGKSNIYPLCINAYYK